MAEDWAEAFVGEDAPDIEIFRLAPEADADSPEMRAWSEFCDLLSKVAAAVREAGKVFDDLQLHGETPSVAITRSNSARDWVSRLSEQVTLIATACKPATNAAAAQKARLSMLHLR
eukprot:CAMPEP_0170138056 /NCGR_PEP_ID=MMETSP0033_2-20121228/4642_1 /TAXON_ID=195969 /ORGANISM="Dolichomastix tenuilepis, Strain CCMP3274" /LENGTH=115 /DNA_ID=CAMNT_0010374015 /DNA_START=59 /DNA_END=403 /DNA_ORIENTATION=+